MSSEEQSMALVRGRSSAVICRPSLDMVEYTPMNKQPAPTTTNNDHWETDFEYSTRNRRASHRSRLALSQECQARQANAIQQLTSQPTTKKPKTIVQPKRRPTIKQTRQHPGQQPPTEEITMEESRRRCSAWRYARGFWAVRGVGCSCIVREQQGQSRG